MHLSHVGHAHFKKLFEYVALALTFVHVASVNRLSAILLIFLGKFKVE